MMITKKSVKWNNLLNWTVASLLFTCPLIAQDSDYERIDDQVTLSLLNPTFSERKTAKIRLKNGLEAYIISDKNADQAAVSLSVEVGSWQNPKEYPGLAHFLEHMLFLGTKKYPEESGYKKYIYDNGGMANAYTASSQTSYIFSIQNEALPEALDRFSHFFKEPLFDPSGVSRELQAIDQEFAVSREDEGRRQNYIHKELANPNHPYHQFHAGNSLTLSNVSRDTLIDWYQNNYSADLMHLIVISSLPLDQLEQLVVENFSSVPTKNKQPFVINLPTTTEMTKKKIVYIEPLKDMQQLSLRFELPPKFAHRIETQPERLICFVLGHEGKESILAQLKRENLATELGCFGGKIGNDAVQIQLSIELTKEGLKNVEKVIERTFQGINTLRQKGIPKYLFDEIQTMAKINYQYQARKNAFEGMMEHTMRIADEPLDTYPEKSFIIFSYAPSEIQDVLNYLTPENCSFDLIASSTATGITPDRREKWTEVEYSVSPIDESLITKWSSLEPHLAIDLPPPNPFIPDILKLTAEQPLATPKKELPHPELLSESPFGTFYYAPDTTYHVPKAACFFKIKTPEILDDDPTQIALTDLYVKGLIEALNEEIYLARLAGIEVSIERSFNGIAIRILGYSENLPLFIDTLLDKTTTFSLSKQKFKIYKNTLSRQFRNFYKESPLYQAYEILQQMLNKRYVTKKEKAAALKRLSFKKFENFQKKIFSQTYSEVLIYGNLDENSAQKIQQIWLATFGQSPYPKKDHLPEEVVILPQKRGPFYIEEETSAQGNAVILAVEHPYFSFKERAAQQICMQALGPAFFSTLRTKQQTGYIVQSMGEEKEKKLFDLFFVQSNTHDVRDLLARFELFIEGFLQELALSQVTEENFEIIRKSLIEQLEHPVNNLKEMALLLNKLAFKYDGDFDWFNKRIEGMQTLSYSEFLTMTKEFLGRSNKRRIAVLLEGAIPSQDILHYSKLKTPEQLVNISSYLPSI